MLRRAPISAARAASRLAASSASSVLSPSTSSCLIAPAVAAVSTAASAAAPVGPIARIPASAAASSSSVSLSPELCAALTTFRSSRALFSEKSDKQAADGDDASASSSSSAAAASVPFTTLVAREFRYLREHIAALRERRAIRIHKFKVNPDKTPTPQYIDSATGRRKVPYLVRRRLLLPGVKPTFFEREMPASYWEFEESLGGYDDVIAIADSLQGSEEAQEAYTWSRFRYPLSEGLTREESHLQMAAAAVELVVLALERGNMDPVHHRFKEEREQMLRAVTRIVGKVDVGYVLTPDEEIVKASIMGEPDMPGSMTPADFSVPTIMQAFDAAQASLLADVEALYAAMEGFDQETATKEAGKAAIDELYAAERAAEEARLAAERAAEEERLAAERKARERRAAILARKAEAMRLMQEADGLPVTAPPAPEPEPAPTAPAEPVAAPKTPEEIAAEEAEAARRAALDPDQDPNAPPVTKDFHSMAEMLADAEQGRAFARYLVEREWRAARGQEAVEAHQAELAAAKEKAIEEAQAKLEENTTKRAESLEVAKKEKVAAAHQAADDFYKFLLEQGAPEEGAKAAADEKRELGVAAAEEELAALAAEHEKEAEEEKAALEKLAGPAEGAEGEEGEGEEEDPEAAAAKAAEEAAKAAEEADADPATRAATSIRDPDGVPTVWDTRFAAMNSALMELTPQALVRRGIESLRKKREFSPAADKIVYAHDRWLDFLDDWEELVTAPVPGADNTPKAPKASGNFIVRFLKRRKAERKRRAQERRSPRRAKQDQELIKWLKETRENHPGFNSQRFRTDFHKYTCWVVMMAYLTRNAQVMRSICDDATYAHVVELFNNQAEIRPGQRLAYPHPSHIVPRKEPVFYRSDEDGGSDFRWEYQFKFRYPHAWEATKTRKLTEGGLDQPAEVVCILQAQLDLENPDLNYKIVGLHFTELRRPVGPYCDKTSKILSSYIPWTRPMEISDVKLDRSEILYPLPELTEEEAKAAGDDPDAVLRAQMVKALTVEGGPLSDAPQVPDVGVWRGIPRVGFAGAWAKHQKWIPTRDTVEAWGDRIPEVAIMAATAAAKSKVDNPLLDEDDPFAGAGWDEHDHETGAKKGHDDDDDAPKKRTR